MLEWISQILKNPADAAVVSGVVTLVGSGLYKTMRKMMNNDLAHIDSSISAAATAVTELKSIVGRVQDVVEKTDAKLDRHLEWHLVHPITTNIVQSAAPVSPILQQRPVQATLPPVLPESASVEER